jgi:hypothetical protein
VRPGRSRWRAQVGGGGALPWEGRLRSEQCRAGLGPGGKGFCAKKVKATGGEVGGKNTKRPEVVGSEKVGSDYKCAYERYKALSIG